MNDTKKLIYRIGSSISSITAIAAAILYVIAYRSSYNLSIRHFDPSAAVTAFCILLGISLAVTFVTSILMRKSGKLSEHAPNYIESFILWMTAFMFIGFGIISVSTPAAEPSTDYASQFSALSSVCASAIIPLTFISAIPFICAASDRLRGCIVHSITSLAPILWGVCLILKYYFDLTYMPLNDPELSVTSIILSAIIIFLISESRSTLNINSPAIYFCGNNLAVTVTGCLTTSRIILSLTSGHSIPSLMENIIFFMIAVLALTRLISFESKVTPIPVEAPAADKAAETAKEASSQTTATSQTEEALPNSTEHKQTTDDSGEEA